MANLRKFRKFFESQTLAVSSLITRFVIMSLVFAVTPLLVLIHLYQNYDSTAGVIEISETRLIILLIFTASAVLVSLIPVVERLFRLRKLVKALRKASGDPGSESLSPKWLQLGGDLGEIARYFDGLLERLSEAKKALVRAESVVRSPAANLRSAIIYASNLDSQLGLILETAVQALGAERGAMVARSAENRFRVISVVGKGATPEAVAKALRTSWRSFMVEGEAVVLPALHAREEENPFGPPLLLVPIRDGGQLGAICLSGRRDGGSFSVEEVERFCSIGDGLKSIFQDLLQETADDETRFQVLRLLASVVEWTRPMMEGHSDRVAGLSMALAHKLDLPAEERLSLRRAALVHDVGHVEIPPAILGKFEDLDESEDAILREHPLVGERMLKTIPGCADLLEPVRHHHEFLDGSGYPDGLEAGAISRVTQILTVANLCDRMLTGRPRRPAFDEKQTFRLLKKMAREGKLDGTVVKALRDVLFEGRTAGWSELLRLDDLKAALPSVRSR